VANKGQRDLAEQGTLPEECAFATPATLHLKNAAHLSTTML
jgi:hypothetical protein